MWVSLWRFFLQWLKLILPINSRATLVAKGAALLFGAGLLTFLRDPVDISVTLPGGFTLSASPTSGLTVLLLVIVVYATFEAGRAWVLSRGAVLRIGDRVEEDDSNGYFRLRVWNAGSGEVEAKIRVSRILGVDGRSMRRDLPIELSWTHLDPPVRQRLSARNKDGNQVDLAMLDQITLARVGSILKVTGQNYRLLSVSGNERRPLREKVWFRITGECENSTCEEWFSCEFDPSLKSLYRWRHERPPVQPVSQTPKYG